MVHVSSEDPGDVLSKFVDVLTGMSEHIFIMNFDDKVDDVETLEEGRRWMMWKH